MSRVYRPPPRDFLCDAGNVGAEVASFGRAAREEAVHCTDRKDVASQGLGLGPLIAEGGPEPRFSVQRRQTAATLNRKTRTTPKPAQSLVVAPPQLIFCGREVPPLDALRWTPKNVVFFSYPVIEGWGATFHHFPELSERLGLCEPRRPQRPRGFTK